MKVTKRIFKNLKEVIDYALGQDDSFKIEKIGIKYRLTLFR